MTELLWDGYLQLLQLLPQAVAELSLLHRLLEGLLRKPLLDEAEESAGEIDLRQKALFGLCGLLASIVMSVGVGGVARGSA